MYNSERIKKGLLAFRKRKGKSKKGLESQYLSFLYESHELLWRSRYFESRAFSKSKKIAINNYLVNLITGLEVYLRGVIMQNKKWNESGYERLLKKEKISLVDAFDLFKKEKVTMQFIVAQTFSFQNLRIIDNVFSELTATKFLKEIELHPIDDEIKPLILKTLHPNWRRDLTRLYEIRNKFVHEGNLDGYKELSQLDLNSLFMDFQMAISDFLEKRLGMTS